jgi:hypothetical protein
MTTLAAVTRAAKHFGRKKLTDEQAQEVAKRAIEAVDKMVLSPPRGCGLKDERAYQLALQVRAGYLEIVYA